MRLFEIHRGRQLAPWCVCDGALGLYGAAGGSHGSSCE
jgi:hypothetical protein